MNAPLSADRVRELLSYDEVTGAFLWRCRVATNIRVGSTAGRLSHKGYREIGSDWRPGWLLNAQLSALHHAVATGAEQMMLALDALAAYALFVSLVLALFGINPREDE